MEASASQRISQIPLFFIAVLLFLASSANAHLSLSPEAARHAGMRIWNNECGGTITGLTSWNRGEEFAFMGIGHFIWYPKNHKSIYNEQFPKLLQFFESQGVTLPDWLRHERWCPWDNKEAFDAALTAPCLKELQQLLADTVDLQVIFITQRLERALPKILNTTLHNHQTLITRFRNVVATPTGPYALIDYVNFKGEGASNDEQYQGKGWGLLQVLELMHDDPNGNPIHDFIAAAKAVLARRVTLAPSSRNENRWLKGWYNRLDTYRP